MMPSLAILTFMVLVAAGYGLEKCFDCYYAKVGPDIHGDEHCEEAQNNSKAVTCDQADSYCVTYLIPESENYVRRFCNATCKEGDGLSPEGPHTFEVKVYCCQSDYCNGGSPSSISSGNRKQVEATAMSIVISLTFVLLHVW